MSHVSFTLASMSIGQIIGIAVALFVIALLAFIATRPADFQIERSAQIHAPADVVFPLINDFRQWPSWSPWEKLDPNMKKTFEGPPAGPGSSYGWSGNSKAGEGRSTIVDSKTSQYVSIKLEMFKPFSCANQVLFTLTPSDAGTRVSWKMQGKNGFMAKAFSALMNMDKMVGKEFEKGLASLDSAARAKMQESDSRMA